MKKPIFVIVFLFIVVSVFSQKYTISGYVEDAKSGERLLSANVYDADNITTGTITNTYGHYSLTIPKQKLKLTSSYIGYTGMQIEFELTKDTVINFSLEPNLLIGEVVVSGEHDNIKSSQMSRIDVPIETVLKMPVLLGEVDVLKTIQMLPGVQSGTEGSSGFYVRGGGPDQNLILLDGVPVYNVNHLFGFFSVFNGYAIKDISLIKGGFPARYGGRLSSVLDIRMKEGNMREYSGEASIGIIASKFTLEGPIIKDKSSFIISDRRAYLDILAMPFMLVASSVTSEFKTLGGYFFYDLNAKVNYKFSDNNRIFLSVYSGKDKAYMNITNNFDNDYYKSKFDLHWGNLTSAFRWNHVFTPKLFCNTTVTYSNYKFVTDIQDEWKYSYNNELHSEKWQIQYLSGIEDIATKFDFDYNPSPNHRIKFGVAGIQHIFKPGITAMKLDLSEVNENIDTTYGSGNLFAQEFAVYLEDDFRIGKRFKMNIGAHYSGFNVRDTFYQSIQPRVSTRFIITKNWSIKASYAHMTQYLHFLTNSSIGLPTDLWLPATDLVPPEKSIQYAVGTAISFPKGIDLTIEGFYKEMDNLVEYKEGASFFTEVESGSLSGEAWEHKIEMGKGWSYGMEFMLQKKYGKINGWIGYTLSWANRQFENIGFGEKFPYRYDRRHDISIVLIYKINEKIDIGATWVYGTGTAVTLAQQRYYPINYIENKIREIKGVNDDYYYFDNMTVDYYGTRNNYRLPAYHRLDFGINFTKVKKRGTRVWNISVYNVYNQKNAFFVDFNGGLFGEYQNNEFERKLVKYSLFPIIPSVSYIFKF